MLDEKVVEAVPPAQNGHAQPQSPTLLSAPAEVQVKPTAAGRVLEMLAPASLAGCVVVLGLNFESRFLVLGLILLLMVDGFVAYKLAIGQAKGAAKQEEGRRAKREYKVTITRLKILEEVGIPDEVISELSLLLGQPSLREDAFFESIATKTDLGRNRTNQFRETILRYTEIDTSPASKPALIKPATPATVKK